jgi:hypothetical protein
MMRAALLVAIVLCSSCRSEEKPITRAAAGIDAATELCGPTEEQQAKEAAREAEAAGRRAAENALTDARVGVTIALAEALDGKPVPALTRESERLAAARKAMGAEQPVDVRATIVDAVALARTCEAVAADDPKRCDAIGGVDPDDGAKRIKGCRGKVALWRRLAAMIKDKACDPARAKAAAEIAGDASAADPLFVTCRAAVNREPKSCFSLTGHTGAVCRFVAGTHNACEEFNEPRRSVCIADGATLASMAEVDGAPFDGVRVEIIEATTERDPARCTKAATRHVEATLFTGK